MDVQAVIKAAAKGNQDEAESLFNAKLFDVTSLRALILTAYCNGAILGMELAKGVHDKFSNRPIADDDARLDVALDRAIDQVEKGEV